jgi:hypothetical protein
MVQTIRVLCRDNVMTLNSWDGCSRNQHAG